MKAFIGKQTFSGEWDDDLDNCLNIFETLARMCKVIKPEMFQSMPIMLSGDALSYFSNKLDMCSTYDEGKKLLREWYNSDEKRARIITIWQRMTLSEELAKAPDSTETCVFRKFVARLVSLQKQLNSNYQGDEFLRDRILQATDIPSIQTTLRDRIPETSQQAVNRIENQLSDKPRSAGSSMALLIDDNGEHIDEAMYSLGKTYGGEARRPVRHPWRGQRGNRGRTSQYRRAGDRGPHQRRLSPHWMQGIKGCFVCGEPHRANSKHPREQVTAAINRHKAQHPNALLTIEDLAAVVEMTVDAEEDVDPDDVQWAEDDEQGPDVDEDDVEAFLIEDDFTGTSDLDHMSRDDMAELETRLANSAFIHGRSQQGDMAEALLTMHDQLGDKKGLAFDGLRLDTGANRASVMCGNQYEAYTKEFGLRNAMRPAPDRTIRGIGGRRKAAGMEMIQIPFSDLGLVIDVDFVIINEEVPSLLSMKDMYTNGLDLSIQGRYVSLANRRHKLAFENFFLIHRWSTRDMPYALYTETDLRRIHRGFGHPSVKSTEKLLRRASIGQLPKSVITAMEKVNNSCKVCNKHASKPRRFKLTLGTEEIRFNNRVYVDTMFINSRPVIHLVDEGTHFAATCFLRSQSATDTWKAILRLWVHTYLGPPDFLAVDQGSAYVSREMKMAMDASGIRVEEAPVENPGTMGIVERYHAPLRSAYTKIRDTLDKSTTDAECLQMAVYATNFTIGPEGLCPMLLVFGALPRPIRMTPCPTQLQRSAAIEEARRAVEKEQAKRRIAFAIRHPSNPKAKEMSSRLRDLPSRSPVLVWRTKPKLWEGPFRFISVEGETAVVQLNRGRRIFRTSCVKPWIRSLLTEPNTTTAHPAVETHAHDPMRDEFDEGNVMITPELYTTERTVNEDIDSDALPGKVKVRKGSPEEKKLLRSRAQELNGLIKDGTFAPVKTKDIDGNPRIFGSRFVDEIKRVGDHMRRKSRLVAQNYSDEGASTIATKAPTVQRFSQRVALSIAASMKDLTMYTRDVTQAYVQSKTHLERPVYIHPPHELGMEKGTVLNVLKPLYGITESGLHWYLTYVQHHIDRLGMRQSAVDPCVLIRNSEQGLEGLILLKVDDTLGLGTTKFLEEEQEASKHFRSKPRTKLGPNPTAFNGLEIARHDDGIITITQEDKIYRIRTPTSQAELASQRALAQYVGVNTRPDVCAAIQLVAPGSKPPTPAEFKSFAKTVKFMQQTKPQGLSFVPLDLTTMRLLLVTDASFANTDNAKSQLGYVILMVDKRGRSNIVHYVPNKSKRVARSVLAAEMHGLSLGFDYAYTIKTLLEEILKRAVDMEALVGSKTLFNVIAKDAATTERRLQIDALALKESYAAGELSRVGWIPGTTNPADPLTKCVLSTTSPLYKVMSTNNFEANPCGWASAQREKKLSECQTQV